MPNPDLDSVSRSEVRSCCVLAAEVAGPELGMWLWPPGRLTSNSVAGEFSHTASLELRCRHRRTSPDMLTSPSSNSAEAATMVSKKQVVVVYPRHRTVKASRACNLARSESDAVLSYAMTTCSSGTTPSAIFEKAKVCLVSTASALSQMLTT